MPVYLKGRSRTGCGSLRLIPQHFSAAWRISTAQRLVFLMGALKWLQWRNGLTSVLVYPPSPGAAPLGSCRLLSAGLTSRLLASPRILAPFGVKMLPVSWREDVFSGPGCYSVTMEAEIPPCSRIYTLIVTSRASPAPEHAGK